MKKQTVLEQLTQKALEQRFILFKTTWITETHMANSAFKFLLEDGYQSKDPVTLVLAVILNAMLTQERIVTILAKKHLMALAKQDRHIKSLPRRLKTKVYKVIRTEYGLLCAALRNNTQIFKVSDEKSRYGREIKVLEVILPQVRSYLDNVAKAILQRQEIKAFYSTSRKRHTEYQERKKREAELKQTELDEAKRKLQEYENKKANEVLLREERAKKRAEVLDLERENSKRERMLNS